MRIIEKGRPQQGWSREEICTGKGNGGGGCGARLLVEQGDLFVTAQIRQRVHPACRRTDCAGSMVGFPIARVFHGAVTTGSDWRLGRYDRTSRHITQDTILYRVPEGLDTLTQVLIKLLTP